jgi:hypothetical protein
LHAEKIEKQAMEIVGREYADFGPTLASEYLERDVYSAATAETITSSRRQWTGLRSNCTRGPTIVAKRKPKTATVSPKETVSPAKLAALMTAVPAKGALVCA